jgi:dihydroxyacetone kinase-like predicted kinase
VAPDVALAATGLIDLLLVAGGELITVLVGQGIDADSVESALRAHVHDRHPGSELVIYRTGHRGDALLIGVE